MAVAVTVGVSVVDRPVAALFLRGMTAAFIRGQCSVNPANGSRPLPPFVGGRHLASSAKVSVAIQWKVRPARPSYGE